MKKIFVFLGLWFFTVLGLAQPVTPPPAQTQNALPPLRIAIAKYMPPFEIEAASKQFYGFDVDMIHYICKSMNRECRFIPMLFADLIPALENNQADIAIGAIIITAERAQRINFSNAYFPSSSRFVTRVDFVKEPYAIEYFNDKKIGVEQGSIFAQQIKELGIKNPEILTYNSEADLVEALGDEEVEFILIDNLSARYWENTSSTTLKLFGPVLRYGFGYGIAVNKNNIPLLQNINLGLSAFLKSKEYKKAYETYLQEVELTPVNEGLPLE